MIIAYRRRGSPMWNTLGFRIQARSWRSFFRQARICRQTMEYARVVRGAYVPVLG